jgi:cytochrome bd ubiquinol oxidase subunit II
METIWFALVGFMLTMYVILDGFDIGAGILHLLVAKTDDERRLVLNAIGPVWDGNEVWLLAAGGTLYFAFPHVYASSFSGFYLPLIIVLWLLMLRGLGIEFRHHVHHPLWKNFWDVLFAFGSILLAIFYGAALGNVVRGVPLNAEGYFFEPLWTTFTVVPEAGILDWFTLLMSAVALCTVTVHGAHYLAMKTVGSLQKRARVSAHWAWWGMIVFSLFAFVGTIVIRPALWDNFLVHTWGFVFPAGGVLSAAGMYYAHKKEKDTYAFILSSAFIGSMLASTAFSLYPALLPASTDPRYSLTIYSTAAQQYGLTVGLVWWIVGMALTAGYFIYMYRSMKGKVELPDEGGGY